MSANRNDRMDYFKGILMFGVLLGHAITAFKAGEGPDIGIHVFVRTYDMPFFILISGIFMAKSVDKYVPWKNILNKLSSILIPLVFWNVLFYLIRLAVASVLGSGVFSKDAFMAALTGSWFLWAALLCSCLMIVICGLFKTMTMRLVASVAISVLFLFVPNDRWNIAFMFPFYAMGFFMEWGVSKISKNTVQALKSICVMAFFILYCFWDTKYNVWNSGSYLLNGSLLNTLFAISFRFFIGVTGCVTMTVVFDILRALANPVAKYINDAFIAVGKNTLVIYIFQGFVLEYLFAKFIRVLIEALNYNPFMANVKLLGYIIAPVTAFVCMIVLNKVIVLMKKIPYLGKYVFGFKLIDAKKR